MVSKQKKSVLAISLLAACTLPVLPAMAQGRPAQPVLVTNGSGQPVPTAAQGTTNVAGTVNVGNTPSVNVANTPSVDIANSPTVTVAPGATVGVTSPLDGQGNPAPLAVLDAVQPYEDMCVFAFFGLDVGSCNFQTIPPGKQLVTQQFDATVGVETGLKPFGVIFRAVQVDHTFVTTFLLSSGGFDSFAASQETRLYTPQNQTPICSVALTDVSQQGSGQCNLSGFLVDVPVTESSGATTGAQHSAAPPFRRHNPRPSQPLPHP
jgi:hypothetical protein